MEDDNEDQNPYCVEQLVSEYAISPQEAERILKQFGSERSDLDLLLGNRGASEVDSPNLPEATNGAFLLDI